MPDQVVLTTQSSSSPIVKYLTIFMVLVMVVSLSANGLFFKTYLDLKKGDAERQKIIDDQKKAITDQNNIIAQLNIKIDEFNKKLDDINKKKGDLDNKKKGDTIHYSKPLPKPEEDKFFADNGFNGTRTGKDGRFFTNEDVVKVQMLVKDNENLKAELCLAYEASGVKDSMIEEYKQKCLSQEKIIASYKEIDEQRQKEIQKYKMEVGANKFYKWTAIIVGGALVGYAAAH